MKVTEGSGHEDLVVFGVRCRVGKRRLAQAMTPPYGMPVKHSVSLRETFWADAQKSTAPAGRRTKGEASSEGQIANKARMTKGEASSEGQIANKARMIRQHFVPSAVPLEARPKPQQRAQSDSRVLLSHSTLLTATCLSVLQEASLW